MVTKFKSSNTCDVQSIQPYFYFQVGVKEAFNKYEEEFHSKMVEKIAAVEGLPPSLFSLFLERVYKRKS